jgi:putative Mg2+ transporter-C (MgtC) family protein
MPLIITWQQIALRLFLASIASLLIGINRDEKGHPAGMRTTMLVCLAATLAMIQVNLLLPLAGKSPSSFNVMDLMRLPLGILTGVGFIGAGVIVKREHKLISGVTTAATLWFVTVLGLLYGGGQIYTGIAGTLLAIFILWILKGAEAYLPREHHGELRLLLGPEAPSEEEIHSRLLAAGYGISRWCVSYEPEATLSSLSCELKWNERASRVPHTPIGVDGLRTLPGIRSLTWDE